MGKREGCCSVGAPLGFEPSSQAYKARASPTMLWCHWCRIMVSIHVPPPCKRGALPIELILHILEVGVGIEPTHVLPWPEGSSLAHYHSVNLPYLLEESRRIERPCFTTPKGSSLVANHLAVPSLVVRLRVELRSWPYKDHALTVELTDNTTGTP